MRKIALFIAIAAAVSCEQRPVAQHQAAATPQPKWMREQKPVEVPAELKKIAERKDPDVERQLTPAEVKATLAAAQQIVPTEANAGQPRRALRTSGDDEWSKLEQTKEQAQKSAADAAEQARLATIVFAGRDGMYHAAGCAELHARGFDNLTGQAIRVYTGTAISLATAKQRGLGRHLFCGAPAY